MRKRAIGPIISDCHPIDQPENSIRHGKNGIQNKALGAASNEPGFLKSSAVIPYTYIGVIETDSRPIVFSTDDKNSAIGYYDPDTDSYKPILDDKDLPFRLKFKKENYIKGEFQKNNLGEYVIAFTDKNLPPMYLNCDNPNVEKFEDLLFFPQPLIPSLTAEVSDTGQLSTGAYKAYVKLIDAEGSETHYLASAPYRSVSENGSGSIRLVISNVDTTYEQVVVSFLIKEENAFRALQLDPVPASETVEVLYTGTENFTTLTPEEILVGTKTYSKVGAIGQLNGSIYFGNLTDDEDIDYQEYANKIQVMWKSTLVSCLPTSVDARRMKSGELKSFCHDEIYAFYIRLVFLTGAKSKAFHVPGPELTPADLASTTKADRVGKVFQFEDTIRSFSAREQTGVTGGWENESELYPLSGFGSLSGKKVRHHKMPSQWFVRTKLYNKEAKYGTSHSDILGIQFKNVAIPPDLVGKVAGYEILYAKRSGNNTTVMGQSPLIMHVEHHRASGAFTKDNVNSKLTEGLYYSSGGNWDNEIWVNNRGNIYQRKRASSANSGRIHPIEMLENKAFLNQENSYLKIDNYMTTSVDVDTKDNIQCIRTILADYTDPKKSRITAFNQPLYVNVDGLNYIDNNLDYRVLNGVQNKIGEQAIALNFADGAFGNVAPTLSRGRVLTNMGMVESDRKKDLFSIQSNGRLQGEDVMMVTLKVLKGNLYQSFTTQNLIETEKLLPINSTEFLFRGDVIKAVHTIHQIAPIGVYDDDVEVLYKAPEPNTGITGGVTENILEAQVPYAEGGIRVIRNVIVETAVNLYSRYKKPAVPESEWYFNVYGTKYAFEFDSGKDPNDIGYTKALNALSEAPVEVFSNRRIAHTFPYRIHRGGKAAREGQSKDWRRFLPLDYYDMQKSFGPIVNIIGLDDNLLVHLENSLLVTRDKTRLETTDSLGVILGTADIFQFAPQEAASSKLGVGGLKSDLACVLTHAGYFFVDGATGEVFLFKGQLQKLNGGLDEFLIRHAIPDRHNPFMGDGITLGYDPDFKRVLLTVKNTILPSGVVQSFEESSEFLESLEVGDVVLIDGEYMEFTAKE